MHAPHRTRGPTPVCSAAREDNARAHLQHTDRTRRVRPDNRCNSFVTTDYAFLGLHTRLSTNRKCVRQSVIKSYGCLTSAHAQYGINFSQQVLEVHVYYYYYYLFLEKKCIEISLERIATENWRVLVSHVGTRTVARSAIQQTAGELEGLQACGRSGGEGGEASRSLQPLAATICIRRLAINELSSRQWFDVCLHTCLAIDQMPTVVVTLGRTCPANRELSVCLSLLFVSLWIFLYVSENLFLCFCMSPYVFECLYFSVFPSLSLIYVLFISFCPSLSPS